jgi:hypothetical protein
MVMLGFVALPFGAQNKHGSCYFSMLANFRALNFMLTVKEEYGTIMLGFARINNENNIK